ncbi:hypothetical protein V2I28_07710, partial [Campylobacter sp. CX2-4080-23]|uniref:hypothetical protein n=1 Tax=Campylobacter porcelli TaxID=1660073 RepID=UPI002EA4192C|nr:hypothetical protein [Campylobacter sp. CX2-4080-23]
VYYTRVYDIKSGSVAPYSYDNWLDLGLNQYFMGQSPYHWYNGDPGDGIYHDKCEILSMEKGYNTPRANARGIKATMTNYAVKYYEYKADENSSLAPRYYIDYPLWRLGDNSGNMILFNQPKGFINGRRYSIIYKVKRTSNYIRSDIYNSTSGTMVTEYIFYVKAYEQTFENGKEINHFRGYSKVVATTHSVTPVYNDKGFHTNNDIKETLQMPYINFIMANLKITNTLSTQNYSFWTTNSQSDSYKKTIEQWSEAEVEPKANYDDLELKIESETLYPVGVRGGLGGTPILNDGRILSLVEYDDRTRELYVFLTETFYADNDMPTRGAFKWYKEWNSHYCLYVYEKKQNFGFLAPVIMVLAVVLTIYTGYGGIAAINAISATAATTATIAVVWTGAILSGIGFMLSMMGAIGLGSATTIKLGKIFGLAGAVVNISTMISNVWTKLSAQVAINASQMSAKGVAVNSGLSQTSGLYATTGFANASSVGANFTTSTTFGLFASGNTYISPLTAIAISQPVGVSQIASMSINMLSSAYSIYSDTRDIFRPANEFSDDEMPTNDDKPKINFIPMNSQYIKRKHYSILENYDLGLERGTLLYIPSVRDRFS